MSIKDKKKLIKRLRKIANKNNKVYDDIDKLINDLEKDFSESDSLSVVNEDLINLYNVKNTSLNYRDEFSANPLLILLDVIVFYILLYITLLEDSKTNEKFTLQIFSITLLIFIVYAFFSIYKSATYVNEKDYKNLVGNLNTSINIKINENYSGNLNVHINDLLNFRERKLKFIDECAQPVSKSKDILIGILATLLGSILLATLKLLLNKWNVIEIKSGINFLAGIYLITLLLLVSAHLILSLSNIKFKLLYQRALSEIKLDTI